MKRIDKKQILRLCLNPATQPKDAFILKAMKDRKRETRWSDSRILKDWVLYASERTQDVSLQTEMEALRIKKAQASVALDAVTRRMAEIEALATSRDMAQAERAIMANAGLGTR